MQFENHRFVANAVEVLKLHENAEIHPLVTQFHSMFMTRMQNLHETYEHSAKHVLHLISVVASRVRNRPGLLDRRKLTPAHTFQRRINSLKQECKEKTQLLAKVKEQLGVTDDSVILCRVTKAHAPPKSFKILTPALSKSLHFSPQQEK